MTKKYSKGTFNNICIPLLTCEMWHLPQHPQLWSRKTVGTFPLIKWHEFILQMPFSVDIAKTPQLISLLIDQKYVEYGKDSK